jgi:hypothetical protein
LFTGGSAVSGLHKASSIFGRSDIVALHGAPHVGAPQFGVVLEMGEVRDLSIFSIDLQLGIILQSHVDVVGLEVGDFLFQLQVPALELSDFLLVPTDDLH